MPGLRVMRDQGVAVLVPPLHHRVVTARVAAGSSAAALDDARATFEDALRSLEARVPALAGRALRDRRVGPAVLPPLRARAGPAGDPDRPPRLGRSRARGPRRGGCLAIPERSGDDGARGERRGRAAPERQPRRDRRRAGAPVRPAAGAARGDERPQRLRRRRPRPPREPAEGDGDAGQDPRRRAHPGESGAVPRLHLDGRRARSARARSPTSRRWATRSSPTRTSPAARTCTSRTSSRTSTPGT